MEISNKNRLLVIVLAVLPDVDFLIDRIYETNFHSFQSIPLLISLVFFLVLYFIVEKYKKFSFLCLMALGSQFFGDLLVGADSFRFLESINAMPVGFYVFMVSFEIIMPIIFLIFQVYYLNCQFCYH